MIPLQASHPGPPPTLRLGDCTALVVEAEPVQGLDLRQTLSGLGCAVLGPVVSGVDAVQLLRQRRPDLALLDPPLRDGGALRVAAALAARQVPFAVLTTGGDHGLLGHLLLRGAPRLIKPYQPAELRHSLRELRRADLRARLDEAEWRFAEGRERLARQLRLTRRFAAAGHEVPLARQLLRGIARSLRLMRTHRSYLRRRLAAG
jgi:CheY-like chemotaxis protein